MAKLEDKVTDDGLLEIVRGGALKNEVIKKFKTSESELAAALYRIYRKNLLTKEEFNDFFQGISLKKPEAAPEAQAPAAPEAERHDEAPSAIFRALTDKQKPAEPEAQPAPEAAPAVQPVPEPEPQPAPEEDVIVQEDSELDIDDAQLDPDIMEEPVEEPVEEADVEVVADSLDEPVDVPAPVVEQPAAVLPVPLPPPVAPAPTPVPAPAAEPVPVFPDAIPRPIFKAQEGKTMDSSGIGSILEMIFAKLSAIEARLAELEKKM